MTAFFILGFLGCGDSASKESRQKESPPKAEVSKETPKQDTAPSSINPQAAKKEPAAKKKKGFDPLEGKALKEICQSHGLLLIKWNFERIQSDFSALCCTTGGLSSDDLECTLDWPFSDVPSCSAYDEMRTEIFARYGRAFKTPKWQKTFGATNWYAIRSDFSNDWLSDVAKKNIELLVQKKANKVACMD